MSNSKNYNSILFITTLSVYFGLVLVGATPSVLAQTTLTVEDCQRLRNKSEEKLQTYNFDAQVIPDYVKILGNILEISREISSTNAGVKSNKNFPFYYLTGSDKYGFSHGNGRPFLFTQTTRQKLETELEVLSELLPKKKEKNVETFTFDFGLSNSDTIATRTKFIQDNDLEAHNLFIAYDSSLDFWRCETRNELDKAILKNTEITFENNQVFIVTHLPRAAIDELLAETDAK